MAWLAYPAAYLALALLVLNHVGRRAPYYFLDPGTIGTASVGPFTMAVARSYWMPGRTGMGTLPHAPPACDTPTGPHAIVTVFW